MSNKKLARQPEILQMALLGLLSEAAMIDLKIADINNRLRMMEEEPEAVKRAISAATRRRMSEGQRRRWERAKKTKTRRK